MGKLYAAVALAALLSAFGPAVAGATLSVSDGQSHYDLTPHVDALEDPGGTLRVDDVLRLDESFAPAAHDGRDIVRSYSDSAYWFRFTLQSETPRLWLLDLPYSRMDEVQFYAPTGDGGYTLMRAGDSVAPHARPIAHRNLVFPLETSSEPHTFYLRVSTEGTINLHATLRTTENFIAHSQIDTILVGAYFGLLVVMMLYNLLLYLLVRERICLLFALFCLGLSIGQASLHGIGPLLLWPAFPQWSNPAVVYGMSSAGLLSMLFTRELLALNRPVRAFDYVIYGSAIAYGCCALIMAAGFYQPAAIVLSLVGILTPCAAMPVVFYCLRRGYTQDRFAIVAWTVFEIGVATFAARSIGLLPGNPFTDHALEITTALQVFLFALAMAQRMNRMRAERTRAQSEALEAERALVAALKMSETELEAKVQARTAELAEANRRLRENERHLLHQSQHDALTGLLNRYVLNDRINHALAQRRRDAKALAVLVIDLDGFKPINDRYGHSAGDAALVETARRLKRCVRDADTVARVGGDEFVVVLESLNDVQEAQSIGDAILQEVARPFSYREHELSVSASLGIACYPEDGDTAEALIISADAAMYRAKRRGPSLADIAGHQPDAAALGEEA